jgi:succinate dehydrogenase/fumarate reductase flavoprotein subunit
MISEGVNMGTSRNTGSDKQTYYKLSLASDGSDSVAEMAKTLFSGGSVNGDTALVEAACSVKSFIKLANLGVPFPTNEYGEYVGYKTDHDPRQRATSAGPLTSKYMTECLQKEVEAKNIAVLDGMMAARLLVKEGRLIGMLAVDKTALSEPNRDITLFACGSLILASGGPASIYYNSVYPESQTGMTGMALEAGAEACNIEEWQYGIASTNFRWNVSGTYQQVIPKYIAVDAQGREREFLPEYFGDPVKAADMVFLKGYQWPFDAMKTYGSSMIDMAIHHEIFDLGNSIFLDFRTNPAGFENGFGALSPEACSYLKNSDALFGTPLERLQKMNPQAVDLYREHHIDLCTELLEVSVCAQHNNGGLRVDSHWQSNIHGLYVAGEAAGTFGVYRPGGAALNSTQVGSMRAAEDIVYGRQRQRQGDEEFLNLVQCDVTAFMDVIEKIEKT